MSGNPPLTPQGNVPRIVSPDMQDYPRLVFGAPYFEQIAIAEIIQPSVTEAVEAALPALVPEYVDAAAQQAVSQLAVLLTGSTMTGPLFLSPLMPTQPSQAATMAYVDAMIATAGIPEVPPVPSGQVWARETGQWVPITPQTGVFLPLSGGSMTGNINMSGNTIQNMAAVPAMPNGAAPAQWVLNQIASVSLYQGTWDADNNVPDLTQLSVRVNGYTWIAITTAVGGVVIGQAIPGLQGTTVFNGDTIIYSTVQGEFKSIHAGGLTLPEADARYVQLAGSQMSGALLLNANASQPLQAVTLQQMQAFVPPGVVPEAPNDGQLYGRNGLTTSWAPVLPLAGGILTGAVTLAGNATANLNPVPLQQMTSAITAAVAGYLPLAGGTMTGLMSLSGNATANLNPVPLQQLNSMLNSALGSYLPLAGSTMTGSIRMSSTLPAIPATLTPALFGDVVEQTSSAFNAYIGTGGAWARLAAGYASAIVEDQTGGNLQVYIAPTGAAGSAITWPSPFQFQQGGQFNAPGTIQSQNGRLIAAGSGPTVTAFLTGGSGVGFENVSNNLVFRNLDGFGNPTAAASTILPSSDDTSWCGLAGQAWFGVAAYSFPQQSDPRSKKDITTVPASGPLAQVLAIPIHNYRFINDAETAPLHWGFLSTEVHTTMGNNFAGWMQGEDANQTEMLNIMDMVAVLWAAMQELATKVSAS